MHASPFSVPEEVKVRVLEDVEESTQVTAPCILSEVWQYVSPGGQEEIEGLTKYIRRLGSAATATEARKTIRTWLHARKRAVVMSIPDLSPYEQMKVLENLVKSVELKHPDFAHRVAQMRYSKEGRTPNQEFATKF